MAEAIGWLIALAVVGVMIWALARENTRLRQRSSEEYERDIYAARDSMLRAGLLELDKFVGEAKAKRAAVEFLKDDEQGQTRTGSKGDDAERTQTAGKEPDEGSQSAKGL
jgi:hypothetical protein